MTLAWHFTDGMMLRDGTPLVVGQTYRHKGPLVMCWSGYHGSRRLIDALHYAPGTRLSRVELSGQRIHDTDKLVAEQRIVLWTLDAHRVIVRWVIWCAYGALLADREAGHEPHPDSWRALAVTQRWLDGDATLDAVRAAAWEARAARAAAWAARATRTGAAAASAAAWAAAWAAGAVRAAGVASAAHSAVRSAQNRKLTALVMAEHRRQR